MKLCVFRGSCNENFVIKIRYFRRILERANVPLGGQMFTNERPVNHLRTSQAEGKYRLRIQIMDDIKCITFLSKCAPFWRTPSEVVYDRCSTHLIIAYLSRDTAQLRVKSREQTRIQVPSRAWRDGVMLELHPQFCRRFLRSFSAHIVQSFGNFLPKNESPLNRSSHIWAFLC